MTDWCANSTQIQRKLTQFNLWSIIAFFVSIHFPICQHHQLVNQFEGKNALICQTKLIDINIKLNLPSTCYEFDINLLLTWHQCKFNANSNFMWRQIQIRLMKNYNLRWIWKSKLTGKKSRLIKDLSQIDNRFIPN